MSALSKINVTLTTPVGHVVTNYGRDVQSVIFRHNDQNHMVSRGGGTNVVTYESHKGTLTLRGANRTYRRLVGAKIISVVSSAGVVYVAGKDF